MAAPSAIVMATVVACGGGSSVAPSQYFSAVAGLAVALETSDGQQTPSARAGSSGSSRASLPAESALRRFAAGLDALDPPGVAKDAHHDLTVATKNLADEAHRLATQTDAVGAGTSAAGSDSTLASSWETACHVLQDVALAKKIDVDLRCVTALHGG
jgi:hypothetical protein